MHNQNYPYTIFNQNFLSQWQLQQNEISRQYEQQKNVKDMVKAVSDYCEAARKVHPDFRDEAMNACIAEVLRQIEKDKRMQCK